MGTPALSRANSNFLTSGGGVTTVNLRNLGDSRTLVLVNGRRFVSGVPGDTAVDLNTIPIDFIERVDLLTGGASATYGSDAVAGVVNIILKRNFDGIVVDAQGGQGSKSDDTKRKLAVTFGSTSADGASTLNENHSAFFEGTYASTKTTTNIEPFPLGADSVYTTSGQVPAGDLVNGALVKNPLVPQPHQRYRWRRHFRLLLHAPPV